jgi:hypothetical protein
MSNADPSRDPGDDDSLLGTLNTVLRKFLQNTDDMLPARVVAYDRVKNRAQVQPLIALVTTSGDQVQRAQIASVPVIQAGGGGFVLSFNLQPGNLGWIKANDRDISLFLQRFKGGPPNTKRMHSFEDAVFIPDVMTGYTLGGEDAEAAVLQSMDGAYKVSVGGGRVKLAAGGSSVTVSPSGVAIVGTLTINGQPYLAHQHQNGGGTGNSGGVA